MPVPPAKDPIPSCERATVRHKENVPDPNGSVAAAVSLLRTAPRSHSVRSGRRTTVQTARTPPLSLSHMVWKHGTAPFGTAAALPLPRTGVCPSYGTWQRPPDETLRADSAQQDNQTDLEPGDCQD